SHSVGRNTAKIPSLLIEPELLVYLAWCPAHGGQINLVAGERKLVDPGARIGRGTRSRVLRSRHVQVGERGIDVVSIGGEQGHRAGRAGGVGGGVEVEDG